ncbi:MAG: hypothetical protein LCH38_03530 [Proteobacteria bacterium]|nr:hypothetical protein [Pseudomonadota bacterium]
MKTYPKCALGRKRRRLAESLPLFAWADAQAVSAHLPETFAERVLMKRFHMPLHMARIIAENANLGGRA